MPSEAVVVRGYRLVKLHEITVPEVKAARDVAGPAIPIMVDTNCPWTVPQAIEMARRLAPLDLHWLEEPVWPPENLAGLAEVRVRGGIATAGLLGYHPRACPPANRSTSWCPSLSPATAISPPRLRAVDQQRSAGTPPHPVPWTPARWRATGAPARCQRPG